jgi:hypothetical protein
LFVALRSTRKVMFDQLFISKEKINPL